MGEKSIRVWSYLTMIILSLCSFTSISIAETEYGLFGEDYWFVEGPSNERIETSNGWNFTIEKVMKYTLDGVILSRNNYTKANTGLHPLDIISPVDIFVGIEDIADDVEKYSFKVDRWEYRVIYWSEIDSGIYFSTHVDNNHLIPHNILAYQCMLELEEGDMIEITGTLVDIVGEIEGNEYLWDTDIRIGNGECEIILVDNITVNGIEWGKEIQGLGIYEIIGIIGITSILLTIGTFNYLKKKKAEK